MIFTVIFYVSSWITRTIVVIVDGFFSVLPFYIYDGLGDMIGMLGNLQGMLPIVRNPNASYDSTWYFHGIVDDILLLIMFFVGMFTIGLCFKLLRAVPLASIVMSLGRTASGGRLK